MFAARHEAQPSFTWREQHSLTQLVCLGSNLVLNTRGDEDAGRTTSSLVIELFQSDESHQYALGFMSQALGLDFASSNSSSGQQCADSCATATLPDAIIPVLYFHSTHHQ
jgi:hypothetical protein